MIDLHRYVPLVHLPRDYCLTLFFFSVAKCLPPPAADVGGEHRHVTPWVEKVAFCPSTQGFTP